MAAQARRIRAPVSTMVQVWNRISARVSNPLASPDGPVYSQESAGMRFIKDAGCTSSRCRRTRRRCGRLKICVKLPSAEAESETPGLENPFIFGGAAGVAGGGGVNCACGGEGGSGGGSITVFAATGFSGMEPATRCAQIRRTELAAGAVAGSLLRGDLSWSRCDSVLQFADCRLIDYRFIHRLEDPGEFARS